MIIVMPYNGRMAEEKINPLTGSTLNPREERYARELVAGKPPREAWVAAGYRPDESRPYGKLAEPDFRREMRAIMEQAGLTREKWAETVTAGAVGAIQHGLTKDGAVVEMGPDWHARAKLLELGAKVYDMLPNPRLDVSHQMSGAVVFTPADTFGMPLLFDEQAIEGEARDVSDQG